MIQYFAQKAVILDPTGTKLLLSTYTSSKYLPQKLIGKYCFLGGRVRPGEDPDESFKMQVRDESGGLLIEPIMPFFRYSWKYEKEDGPQQIIAVAFLCAIVSGEVGESTNETETTLSRPEWVDIASLTAENMVIDEHPAIQKLKEHQQFNPFSVRERIG